MQLLASGMRKPLTPNTQVKNLCHFLVTSFDGMVIYFGHH